MRRALRACGFVVVWGCVACGSEGGELRDATRAREAQQGPSDSAMAPPPASAVSDTGYEVPVFASDSAAPGAAAPAGAPAPATPVKADSAARRDSAAAPAATPPVAAPAAPVAGAPPAVAPAGFGMGAREVKRSGAGATLSGVRFGRNAGFDRMVLDFAGGVIPAYRVSYASGPVRGCGSGDVVPVAGQGRLVVHLPSTRGHDDAGHATVDQRGQKLAFPVLKEVQFTCDFEGEVEIVLGVTPANKFRVLEMPHGRLAVDVMQ
jgi:hypothetical protein